MFVSLLIGFVFFVLIFIFLTILYMKVDSHKLYSLYLAVVSFVGIVAISINLWIVLTSVWKYFIISDQEYIQYSRSYDIKACEEPKLVTWAQDQRVERTKVEIDKCKADATSSAIMARRYDLKDMFISSWAWMIVFLVVFLFHYPKFLKSKEI